MASEGIKSEEVEHKKAKVEALPQKFNYLKNRVALVKLDDYEPENVNKALIKIIELLELKEYFKGKSIILKPNALAPTKNAFTPTEMMTELIKIIREDAKDIIVGDSTLTKKITTISLKRSKIKEECEKEGAKVLNFFESEREKVAILNPPHRAEESLYLAKEVINADLIINIPKLKTHKGYIYTGAIKNFYGLLSNKMHMHMVHKDKVKFQELLGDIYFAVEQTNNRDCPKVLTIMDAVIAMEGKGPKAGKPKKIGLLVAGFNSAAVDIVGYTLMNGKPKDLDAINSLAERTELPVDISQLDLVGEDYKDYVIKNFKKPPVATIRKREIQDRFSKISDKIMSISIKVNQKKCILCEQCVKHCPAEAMFKKKEKILIDPDKCVQCFCCGETCNNNAISAKWYLFRILPYLLLGGGIVLLIIGWLIFQFITNIF